MQQRLAQVVSAAVQSVQFAQHRNVASVPIVGDVGPFDWLVLLGELDDLCGAHGHLVGDLDHTRRTQHLLDQDGKKFEASADVSVSPPSGISIAYSKPTKPSEQK